MLFFKVSRIFGWIVGFGALIAHILDYAYGLDFIFSEQNLLAYTMTGALLDVNYQHIKTIKELNALKKELGR